MHLAANCAEIYPLDACLIVTVASIDILEQLGRTLGLGEESQSKHEKDDG